MIDFSNLALSPNESRAARNYLGLSQAQAATKSNLPAHKLKRFEAGNYMPDSQFLEDLRAFYEQEGYNFHDERAPGARARADGDVFPAGVVDWPDGEAEETDGSPSGNHGKPRGVLTKELQYMRIGVGLEDVQIDRILECIDENEAALTSIAEKPIARSFWNEGNVPQQAQLLAITALRHLAENGFLHAKLLGRDLIAIGDQRFEATAAKTIGQLLDAALGDLHRAVVAGDKAAQARRKGREEPTEVLQVLVG